MQLFPFVPTFQALSFTFSTASGTYQNTLIPNGVSRIGCTPTTPTLTIEAIIIPDKTYTLNDPTLTFTFADFKVLYFACCDVSWIYTYVDQVSSATLSFVTLTGS